jgi:hypothetical protein
MKICIEINGVRLLTLRISGFEGIACQPHDTLMCEENRGVSIGRGHSEGGGTKRYV